MLDPPRGLHRDDAEHEGESAAQWVAACEERMARRADKYRATGIVVGRQERAQHKVEYFPEYTPVAVVEELAAGDPDFDRRTDQYERIMFGFSSDVCCPGFSYLGVGNCPVHN